MGRGDVTGGTKPLAAADPLPSFPLLPLVLFTFPLFIKYDLF